MPAPMPGMPCPIVFAEEDIVVLSYSMRDEPPFQPTTAPLAIIRFGKPYLHFFGPPLFTSNEEAGLWHPLAGRGLFPDGVFRVDRSSLVRHFERMNSYHSYCDLPRFDRLTHYIFTFHDSTFECVSGSLDANVENCGFDEEHSRMLAHLNSE